ncbi:MAG: hypothetical protein IT180_07065 [Acidobacteria bacterium]|nr:hypothetical protein [Acidobacteriota bacterium]
MRLAELLRLTALGIVLLCWLDPPIVVAPRQPVAVDVALLQSDRDAMPADRAGTATIGERVREAGQAIATALGAAGEVHLHESPASGRLPCDAQRPCVIVSGGGAHGRAPADRRGPTFLVRVGEALTPNVTVTGLTLSAAHTAASGDAVVGLRGQGVNGRDTRVRLMDGGAVVGEAVYRWTGDGEARVEVPWWPVSAGTRTLVAKASLEPGAEETGLDNEARAAVAVADGRWPILEIEPRPSWAATFARRAIEGDRRFAVDARTDVAPGVTARTAASPLTLDAEWLDRANVVLVGAPEALSASDVDRLDAFVRQRGGALILVPDRAFSGPVTRLLAQVWRERVAPTVSRAGGLEAREWLIAESMSRFDEVIATGDAGPAVVSTPVGLGRVVVVGALDAWRHREAGAGFDAFWRDTVARLAQAAGPALVVTAEPRVAMAGDDLRVQLTARSVQDFLTRTVSARLKCGGAVEVAVRLWPDHGPGTFQGRARVPAGATRCEVTAGLSGLGEGRADVVVTQVPASADAGDGSEVEALVARTGGLVVSNRRLTPLTDALLSLGSDIRTPEARYPMRSPWWLLPLAVCLGSEWWLRRRAGLR